VISVEQLGLSQGAFHLAGVAFAVPKGMYAVLMGATGSGKTTLLEAIAGLRPVRAGRILLDGRDVTGLSPAARGLGYVPQDNTLFRTRTVFRNLSFALELRDTPHAEIDRRVSEMAGWLRIEPLLDRYPAGLSGGEAQRVALGRALIFKPPLLLLDEPLSSLDDDTRSQLVEILQALRQRREVTVLHITHNRAEAESLADLRFHLASGTIREAAKSAEF
jgi:molybdate/tungstate transport system ATP-binding protein